MRFMTVVLLLLLAQIAPGRDRSTPWVTAYYAGWMQGNQWSHHLTPQEIDYDAVTHIVHFSLLPNADGTLNDQGNGLDRTNAKALTRAAHAASKKVIVCVGGWNTESAFASATDPVTRPMFIRTLLALVRNREYDGIDIDWEPVSEQYHEQYVSFMNELRDAIDGLNRGLLLTVACMGDPSLFARIHTIVDQVNIMTYDFSGAWPGWLTWHNAAVYSGGVRFPGHGGRACRRFMTASSLSLLREYPQRSSVSGSTSMDTYGMAEAARRREASPNRANRGMRRPG